MAANNQYTATHITTGTVVINRGKPTIFGGIWVNKALTGTVTILDGSTTIAILTNGTTAPLGALLPSGNGGMSTQGLTITCSATEDLTVFWG